MSRTDCPVCPAIIDVEIANPDKSKLCAFDHLIIQSREGRNLGNNPDHGRAVVQWKLGHLQGSYEQFRIDGGPDGRVYLHSAAGNPQPYRVGVEGWSYKIHATAGASHLEQWRIKDAGAGRFYLISGRENNYLIDRDIGGHRYPSVANCQPEIDRGHPTTCRNAQFKIFDANSGLPGCMTRDVLATSKCPAGTAVIGGGCFAQGKSSEHIIMRTSAPTRTGDGWRCAGHSSHKAAWAICSKSTVQTKKIVSTGEGVYELPIWLLRLRSLSTCIDFLY